MTTTVITLISVSVSFNGIVWLHKMFESLLWCLFCHFRAWKPSFLIHLHVENGRIILEKFILWVPQKKRDFNLGNKGVNGDKFSFWGRRSHTLAMLWPSINFFGLGINYIKQLQQIFNEKKNELNWNLCLGRSNKSTELFIKNTQSKWPFKKDSFHFSPKRPIKLV